MKHLAKGLVLASALIAASNTYAFSDGFTPVIGADYEWTFVRGNDDWRKIVPRSYSGGGVYLGGRFCDTIGLELGYNFTNRKSRTRTFVPGDTFFGYTLPAATTGSINTAIRFHEVHFDLQGFLPICNGWELLGTVGLGWVQPKFRSSVVLPPLAAFGIPSLTSTDTFSSGAKVLLRVGLGAQYTFCESWGIRGMARWKNTSSLRIKGTPAYAAAVPLLSISNRPFEDEITLSLGLFYSF